MELQCNNGCNNTITKQEIINLINSALTQNNLLFVGAIVYISKEVYDANFSSSGLGLGNFNKWALANGNNGTENWTGRIPVTIDPTDSDFNTASETGGSKVKTITISNLPDHDHVIIPPTHTHEVTIPSHGHSATAANSLSSGTASANGGSGSYSVSGQTSIGYKTINIDNSGATAIKVLVSLTETPDQSELFDLQSGTVVLPNHTHTTELAHSHQISVDSSTSSSEVSSSSGSEQFNSTSVGGGQEMNVMNPYIVAIPIQRIS